MELLAEQSFSVSGQCAPSHVVLHSHIPQLEARVGSWLSSSSACAASTPQVQMSSFLAADPSLSARHTGILPLGVLLQGSQARMCSDSCKPTSYHCS